MSAFLLITLIDVAAQIALPALVIGIALAFYRLVRGPSHADRAIAVDLITILSAGILGIHAINENNAVFLDAAIVVVLISFLATIGFARHVQREPYQREESDGQ